MQLYEAIKVFVVVGYVRKMTVKKSCKYGEYGSLEHLLFELMFILLSIVMSTMYIYQCRCSVVLHYTFMLILWLMLLISCSINDSMVCISYKIDHVECEGYIHSRNLASM